MGKLFILTVFVLGVSLANATDLGRHKKPKETKDSNVLDITKNQGTVVVYETPAELKAKFEKDAELKMWDASKREEEWSKYPKGGWLTLSVGRMTLGAADTRYFTIVVKDKAGQETFRKELEPSVASPFHAGSITVWKNLKVTGLPNELKTGTTVYIIDALSGNRHEYLIKND